MQLLVHVCMAATSGDSSARLRGDGSSTGGGAGGAAPVSDCSISRSAERVRTRALAGLLALRTRALAGLLALALAGMLVVGMPAALARPSGEGEGASAPALRALCRLASKPV